MKSAWPGTAALALLLLASRASGGEAQIKFESLPLELAVKVQRGDGTRVLAMFSDPYCPACRRFERSLREVDNVMIYVFMYPVIRPENAEHSRAVWCAPGRARARLELAAAEGAAGRFRLRRPARPGLN